MKRILTTTAMVAMTAGSAFAFDSTATGTALDAEVTAANNAIDAVNVTVTFERYDGTTDTFTPALAGATTTVSNSIKDVTVVQYTFDKVASSASFSLTAGTTDVEATAETIADAVNGVNSTIQSEFYGTVASGADLATTTTVGIVGEMIQTFVVDVPLLNAYAVTNLVTVTPGDWAIFDSAAGKLTTNLTSLNTTITNVDTALTETNAG